MKEKILNSLIIITCIANFVVWGYAGYSFFSQMTWNLKG